ncbi:MAG TPA: MarR family transcriptional regulator [Bacillales bacterium]|nr:MarR family transcriptional regulator [Bacillales bacterium]
MRRELKIELTGSQRHLLQILEKEGPLNITELAEKLQITLGGVTSLSNRMEKASLIERRRSEEDRRVVKLAITSEGQSFLNDLDLARDKTLASYFDKLSAEELSELERLCRKMLHS